MWVAVKVLYQNTVFVLMTEYGQQKMEAGVSSEILVHMDNTTMCYAQFWSSSPSNSPQCISLLNGISSKFMRCVSNIG